MNLSNRNIITFDKDTFHLHTANTSYIFRITKYGHLEHLHYGAAVSPMDTEALALKSGSPYGSSVMYKTGDEGYCLDSMALEWSGEGRGDYRVPPFEVSMNGGSTSDFRYVSHRIAEGSIAMDGGLPTALGAAASLEILLLDQEGGGEMRLVYSVYPGEDVITRRTVLRNICDTPLTLRKLMSLCVDIAEKDLYMMTFTGGWITETHREDMPVLAGAIVSDSRTGSSSNRANPGFILRRGDTTEGAGKCWGFNLVYSGNHHSCVARDGHGVVRVMCGINPERFSWTLQKGESFETPEAVMSFSDMGLCGLSRHMHDFVNARIVRGKWAGRERPVLVNVWEAFMFSFNREKLLGVAKRAKRIGAELFVLDDGWFGERDHDRAGLGDYHVNSRKLPKGLPELVSRVRELGLDFGLWFEPEAVNEDSRLYRRRPDWVIGDPGREKVLGRNELLLDLTREDVRDYIVDSVGAVLDSADISYVKWDMNRHMAGMDGAFAHRYILGLYSVLERLFAPRPDILLETCSSGGNRFDLGMLCYSSQIWASDNTDPIERLDIQKGLSYLYPLSAIGAHVSAAPHAQSLRNTPLCTRFNLSCFGDLGYELDLTELTGAEEKEVREQIEFYKKHRRVFQYGDFYRGDDPSGRDEFFTVVAKDGTEAVAGHFRRLVHSAPGFDMLSVPGLERQQMYRVETKPQTHGIGPFGRLIAYALPLKLSPRGRVLKALDKLYALPDCVERYEASGAALESGIRLANLMNGTGYNKNIRLPGDFGSSLYVMTRYGKTKLQ